MMREVSCDEFYEAIGTQNVHPWPTGLYPYKTLFRTQSGEVRGVAEGYFVEGSGLARTRYWIPDDMNSKASA